MTPRPADPARALRGYVLTALFAAAAAAGGYLLIAIPNVELFTVMLFAAGYTLGAARGVLAAVTAALLYFGLNPQGGLFPPLLASQMLGAMAAPVVGSLWKGRTPTGRIALLLVGLSGALVTLWFDILTNLAYPLAAGLDLRQIGVTMVAGIPFAAIHIGSNTLIFALLAPPLLALLTRRHLGL